MFGRKKNFRVAFVTPWFGEKTKGGAQNYCRDLVYNLKRLKPNIKVDVLTTCLLDFTDDWNHNVFEEKCYIENDVQVFRFQVTVRDRSKFVKLNEYRLMPHLTIDLYGDDGMRSPLKEYEEKEYIDCMVSSPNMYKYIKANRSKYDYFIFLPYMFATSFYGSLAAKKKAIIIPCLHDERYAYVNLYQKMIDTSRACFFLDPSEKKLGEKLYGLSSKKSYFLGGMVPDEAVSVKGDSERFRNKYHIKEPFVLYAGRMVEGKNVLHLVRNFIEFKNQTPSNLKLVLVGAGGLDLSAYEREDIVPLGFVSNQDKVDAMNAALVMCQPSTVESFSIVIMEAWLQGTPVMVPYKCDVTREHCLESDGGEIYRNQEEFNNILKKFLSDSEHRNDMAAKGKDYVLKNFTSETIVNKFETFVSELSAR